ncbi:MAG: OsmC family protein [Aerococcus sp.]|nr:OsmC family protein [Aerococcus sp.]
MKYTSEVTATNKQHYEVEATADGFSYTLDFPERAEEAKGTSPTTLLLVALAGCHVMTAASYFSMNNHTYQGLSAHVSGEFARVDGQWQVEATVTLKVKVTLDDNEKETLYHFVKKNCRVGSILENGTNTVELTILVEEEAS